MKKREITIEIGGGATSIDLSGFEGKGCSKLMDEFRGKNKVKTARVKPEYYQAVNQQKATVKQ